MPKIVLDVAYSVQHKRCTNKRLTIEKLKNAVSVKRILYKTFQEKLKTTMSLKFAKKKDSIPSSAPSPPTKNFLRIRIRKYIQSPIRRLRNSNFCPPLVFQALLPESRICCMRCDSGFCGCAQFCQFQVCGKHSRLYPTWLLFLVVRRCA